MRKLLIIVIVLVIILAAFVVDQWYEKSLTWQSANEAAAEADAELQGFFTEAARLVAPANKGASAGETNAETESNKSKTQPADSDTKDE